ncbi:molecular chaperone DjlA [Haematobacter massiliensis]|uniref:Dimethylmenaquinone methyltransferase n=1 Tax=Haematobacter massiliensis TaxID=195105 RepID=A0A086YCC6_9RHOB|nr:molecular chaperone DjiA [Haematobacter massiliensis]KFI31926.1 dimethylmenaquinone methyltransferase [Haematobacter massiliensis]OWJ72543.1 molecular chaperone DjlA [Haematobacter massiliensis]OWJ87882.1 molecular chaperone DjlA [Haematobacter massiliensis]QBJ24320.1 molecular chaperone DjiA [Haematobacter massiliensis]
MSIWSRIRDALAALAQGESLSAVFERLRAPPERSVAFTIAVIALGAKMAKADGEVKRSEVAAFREVFHIPEEEEPNAARVYNLARQDVAGYEAYARKIAGMFRAESDPVLIDLMDGLFRIAVADGGFHEMEEAFLKDVAEIFGLSDRCYRSLRARHVSDTEPDPYEVLGVSPDAPMTEVRDAWRSAVRDSHPDRMQARGVPPEAVRLAERRLVAINRAWETIGRERAA